MTKTREGTHWGVVVSTQDPEKRDRLQVHIPEIMGDEVSDWIEPDSLVVSKLEKDDAVWVRALDGDTRNMVYHIPWHKDRATLRNTVKEGAELMHPKKDLRFRAPKDQAYMSGKDSSVLVKDGKVWAMEKDATGNLVQVKAASISSDSSSTVFSGGKVHCLGPNGGGGYVPCVASVHEIGSDPTLKHDIRKLSLDPVKVIRNAPATVWKYIPEHSADQRDHIGPMLHELPDIVKSGSNVDTQALIGILWAAVTQLADRVEYLEAQLNDA